MLRLLAVVCLLTTCAFAVNAQHWQRTNSVKSNQRVIVPKEMPSSFDLYELDLAGLNASLQGSPVRGKFASREVTIQFPSVTGVFERYTIMETNTLHPDLQAKYPGIKSYAGKGIDDPSATIRFSVSQLGFHGMVMSGKTNMSYIDPHTADKKVYKVYSRSSLSREEEDFQCLVDSEVKSMDDDHKGHDHANKTNDSKLRKYRLAIACTADYGNIFAGSGTDAQKTANILAQMNVTMTRVNGVYERDLAITMEIVPNNDQIIYFGATNSDPWNNEFNNTTQTVIDNAIGDANYDIGHLFLSTQDNGNAGCIGCVCTSGSKGSAFTARTNPTGDPFDIDYVAHEMGHQFGGYHVMNTCSRSGSGSTEVEPASGSTIMGYAGICSSNVQSNSDAYFAYVNIRDISNNIQNGVSSGCAQEINLSNNPPTANAGADYTIPRSTAFVLRGAGTDPDGDVLTYCWEQNDPERAPGNGSPASTWTQGPLFRSIEGTTSPNRYMPNLNDVIAGNLSPTWEVVPSVARTMEFALTVRDNAAGGGQTNDDLMTVTVNGSAGPFVVNAPNTSVTWNVGQSQTVTWDVAGTSSAPVSCANVNILLSTDGGLTYPITLAANTPNDGSQSITVPNNVSTNCRIMVEAADNIFYDISNANFSIEGAIPCTATTPTGLAASGVTASTANLNWNAVSGATYDVRYRETGTSTWTVVPSGGNALTLTSLTALTTYEAQVRSACSGGSNSAYSASANFTTTEVQLNYCSSNGNNVSDEYIGNVQVGSINNSSGVDPSGYTDFTSISTDLTLNTSYNISVTPTWTGTIYSEGYAAWIDYNKDGDFEDAGEQIFSQSPTQATPVSGSFTVPASATQGVTRMRVSLKYNGIPTPCESFTYGEVEDYTVNIVGGTPDTQAPSTPTNLASANITASSFDISWTASTDNVGVNGYNVYLNGSLDGTSATTNYSFSGLSANTSYTVAVEAYDAAGNTSGQASTGVTTADVGSCTNVTVNSNDFESGFGIWNDGGSDCRRSANDAQYSNGTYSIRLRDNTSTSVMTTDNLDLSSFEEITVSFSYLARSMDNANEDFWLQVSTNGGSSYTIVEEWNQGDEFVNNVRENDAVTIQGPFTSNTRLRFRCDASGNSDWVYIDDVVITGCTTSTSRSTNTIVETPVEEELPVIDLSEITVYPNPVSEMLNVVGVPEDAHVSLISLSGQVIGKGIGQDEFDMSALNPGIYILKVVAADQVRTMKILKQ
ncbi:MAG: zinc-dependent metalloprotease family protein [Cytophagales bacterium]|nr:zinc-dependent metalloprotease family protein [Cytophagales bacterium]